MTDKIRELVDKLNEYAYHYYVKDDPIVSDYEYDKLYDELVELEKATGIVLPDSPTRKIGGEPVLKFQTHKHINKLYSLDKCQSAEGLLNWHNRIIRLLGSEPRYTLEQKLDGLTLCLTYDNGYYVRATTRGNGTVGEDVTEQVRTIKGIPLKIEYQGLLEVQGEGIMRLSALEAYNKIAKEPLKNARNGAAGAIRNLDPKITAQRNLSVFFYNVNYIADKDIINSQMDMMEFLQKNHFRISQFYLCKSINEVIDKIRATDRHALDYEIDGMVIKVNDLQLREKLGYTDKFPKWAIAYKFEAEEITTIIKDVIWQVGRTGKLTPLALLEPVELSGATISRATLNNTGDIERKKVGVGARVFLRRSNDVIPEITGLAEKTENFKPISTPAVCPSCAHELITIGANIFCPNEDDCPAQIKGRLELFVSKDCMDIEGLSEKTIHQLYTVLGVRYPVQLYSLTKDELLKIEGIKDKKAQNILDAIESSKGASLAAFINALGIPSIGRKTAKDLADKYRSVEAFLNATYEELLQIEEIGEIIAKNIVEYIDRHRFYVIKLSNIINPKYSNFAANTALKGKKIVVTGSLQNYSRKEVHKAIEEAGGIISTTVTKDTDFVLVGEDAGSKLQKAKELGIKIINENEFVKLIV